MSETKPTTRRLGSHQAAALAYAAQGLYPLAAPRRTERAIFDMRVEGLLTKDGFRLTDAGRAALEAHIQARRPIAGMNLKEPAP